LNVAQLPNQLTEGNIMRCDLCIQPHELGPDFYAGLEQIRELKSPPNRPHSKEDINNMMMREREMPGFFSSLPPIHLMHGLNNELWLLDGLDRYIAASLLRRENIKATLHPLMDEASIRRFRFRANDIGRGNDRQARILHGVFLAQNCGMSLRDAAREARLNNVEGKGGGEMAISRLINKLKHQENGASERASLTPDKAAFGLLTPVWRFAQFSKNDSARALADALQDNPDFIPVFKQTIATIERAISLADK